MRIITRAKIFEVPSTLDEAIGFVTALRERPNCVLISPGSRHWGIFVDLCRKVGAKGNLIPDAYLAALAIESGSEWITTDRDYARFPGLRWRHPLD
jgi:toxin-antitoxin system PIN domain toxin